MSAFVVLSFAGVGLEVFVVAWVTFVVLVFALLAAAANYFFLNVARFDDHVREMTMPLDPEERRRFYALYESRHPKDAAVAWFLAVGLGPIGSNLYRTQWSAFFAAVVSLNGLGVWWVESWFTTPGLVMMKNREYAEWASMIVARERAAKGRDLRGAPPPDVVSDAPVLAVR